MYTMMPFNRMNNLNHFWNALDDAFFTDRSTSLPFRVDLQDTGDSFTLSAELPGFRKEDIALSIQAGVLTISAEHSGQQERNESGWVLQERHSGSYRRSFTLTDIQEDAVTASYQDGVLTLNLPKAKPEAPKTRQIEIR